MNEQLLDTKFLTNDLLKKKPPVVAKGSAKSPWPNSVCESGQAGGVVISRGP